MTNTRQTESNKRLMTWLAGIDTSAWPKKSEVPYLEIALLAVHTEDNTARTTV